MKIVGTSLTLSYQNQHQGQGQTELHLPQYKLSSSESGLKQATQSKYACSDSRHKHKKSVRGQWIRSWLSEWI